MNTDPKTIIVIMVDEHRACWTAAGEHVQPKEALRQAWTRLMQQMGMPADRPAQPAPEPREPEPLPTPDENAEPKCPTHKISKPSKRGGLFCPGKDDQGNFCTWTYGQQANGRKST